MKRYQRLVLIGGALACLGFSAMLVASTVVPDVQQGLRQHAGARAQEEATARIVASQESLTAEQRTKAAAKADRKAGAGRVFEAKKIVLTFAEGVGEAEALDLVKSSPVIDDGKIWSQSFGAPVVAVEAQVAPEFTVAQAEEVLESDARVKGAQPNFYYTLAGRSAGKAVATGRGAKSSKAEATTTDDPYRSKQNFLNQVKAYEAWDYAKTDNKVTIAVIDTGIDVDHPDLKANIVGPYDVVGDNKGDDTPSVPDDSPDDVLGHGTHCAGLAAGVTGNGRGIASVSYNANVMPIKVFYYSESAAAGGAAEPYVSSSVDILSAYNYLMENASKYNVHVASMSLGGAAEYDDSPEARQQKQEDDLCIEAVQKAYDDYDVVTVAAAGNEHTDAAQWPADSAPCIGVIALDESGTGRDTSYSNYGPTKKISAPGTNIFSTCWDGDTTGSIDAAYSDAENGSYGTMTGTSMATPIVAGATALLFAADDTMTAARAEEILCNTATDLGAKGRDDQTGYGALDAGRMAKSVARADVASINGLPTGAVVGQRLELSGTVTAAGTANGAPVRSSKIDYELLDAGDTGASLSGSTFRAAATGTATIRAIVKEGAEYCRDYTQDFQVKVVSASLSDHGAISGLESSYVYTGSALEPRPTVTIDGHELVEGKDYELAYTDNVACGTATVTVTGTGDITGSASASFAIAPRPISDATVTGVGDRTYTGAAVDPEPSLSLGGKALSKGADYTVSYGGNVGPGTGTVVISGRGNFTGTRTLSFRIARASLASARVMVEGSFTYTGTGVEPSPTVELGGRKLVQGTDFVASYNHNLDAGTAELIVSGIGGYAGVKGTTFQIARADLSQAKVADIPEQTWTGKAVKPAPEVSLGGRTLVAGTDYTLVYSDNVGPGIARVTAMGAGNSEGSLMVEFRIVRRAKAGMAVTRSGASYTLVRSSGGKLVASFGKLKNRKAKKAMVPAKVKVLGTSYDVTQISKRAFYGCKKLRSVTVRSRKISKVGSRAFGKTSAKLKVRTPAGRARAYKRLFVKAGLSKKAKVR